MQATMKRERKRSKVCTIRFEYLLWGIIMLMAILIVKVNVMLLGQSSDDSTSTRTRTPQEKDIDKDKERLLEILRLADISETPELTRNLPSWQQVLDRFGDKPKIIGLETCKDYNAKVPLKKRILAPAGTFNSGTNLLFETLHSNCKIITGSKGSRTGIDWQVNWGKHQSPRFRMNNSVMNNRDNSQIMPIVMVRDPYTWMQSMCKTRYSAHWFHIVPHHENKNLPYHCPNLIPNDVDRGWFFKQKHFIRKYYEADPWKVDNVVDKANFTLDSKVVPVRVRYKSANIHHDTLAHMWKDWYQEYFDADFPRLMIRLEDLVFHPHSVLKALCDCVEGTIFTNLTLKGTSAKGGEKGEHIHGKNQTTLADAMIKHTLMNRTKGLTIEDLQFAKQALEESIMGTFGYHHPVS